MSSSSSKISFASLIPNARFCLFKDNTVLDFVTAYQTDNPAYLRSTRFSQNGPNAKIKR